MRVLPRLMVGLSLLCAGYAQSADWLVVARDRLRSVEIDRSSVVKSDKDTMVAWGRIVMGSGQVEATGYKSVKTLNRYDCSARSFSVVKRVYLSATDEVLREENADASKPSVIRPGTVDERFFAEVCPPAGDKPARSDSAASRRAASVASLSKVARDAEARAKNAREGITLVKEEPATKPSAKEEAHADSHAPAPAVRQSPPPTYTAHPATTAAIPAGRRASKAASVAPQIPVPPPVHAHWSYEGEGGPEAWGRLSPENAACANGQRQSPIDIREGIKVDQEAIQFDYKPSYFRIVDNGHTIQVNYGSGSRLSVMGRNFELVQFHFHRPAEERIDGRTYDMVVHLVHRDSEGKLAVVAVMLERGADNPLIQTLWNNLPLEKNQDYAPRIAIQVADLLPAKRRYYSYMGSLTTPPCSEGVLWLVMKDPMPISDDQINVFARFYERNARPIQPTNGRVIKESR